jgi:aminoglycoside phosphotransferase (APT) family kinase protein
MTLDPARILSDLGVRDAPDAVTPVNGGWDTSLWRIDIGQRRFALRVFRPEQAKTCHREALVMEALRNQSIPVPSVDAEGVGQGRPALLLGWCSGRPLLEQVAQRPWRVWQLGRAMGVTHARVHATSLPEVVVDALPRAGVQVGDSRQSVLHLDYHPLNILTDGEQITAVLDWANTAVGDRRADLARTITLLRLAPTPPGSFSVLQQMMRGLLELAWRRGYSEGQAADPFVDMDPFYVWAGEWMETDLQPKLGRPGVWLQETDLLRIRQWTMARKKRVTALDESADRRRSDS